MEHLLKSWGVKMMNKNKMIALIAVIFLLSCSLANKNVKASEQGYIIPYVPNYHSYPHIYEDFLNLLAEYKEEPFKTGDKNTKYRIHAHYARMSWFATFEENDSGGIMRIHQPHFMFLGYYNNCYYLSDYNYQMSKYEWTRFENEIYKLGFWKYQKIDRKGRLLMEAPKKSYLIEGMKNGLYMKYGASGSHGYIIEKNEVEKKDKPEELKLPHFIIRLIIRNFYSEKAKIVEYPISFQKKKHVKDILCKEKLFDDLKDWVY